MASSDCDDHINKLPDGILPEIFSYLPLTDRKTASLVCRLWGQEAFSARVLADVEFVLTYLNQATVLELLRNSTRLYRNVIVYEMFTDSFKLVVGFLDKFGTTIEGFNLNDSEAKPAQLKAYADMMPNLKRLTTFMTKMEKIPNEPLVFPVLSWLHEVHVRFWTDEALNRYQFDVLRMAPNLQRLHLASTDSNGNVRMFEVLKGCSNQLKSLKLCIFSIEYPRCKLRFDNLEVFKLRGLIDDVDRLLQLFQGLSELKVLHLNVMIKKSELETICNRCTKLEIMNIETDMLENGSLIYLCNLPNLQILRTNHLRMPLLAPYKPINSVKELKFLIYESYSDEKDYVDNLFKVFPNVCIMKLFAFGPGLEYCASIESEILSKFIHLTKLTIDEVP